MRRALAPLAIATMIALPLAAGADVSIGPETHVPWSLGARLEWRPIREIRPSISVGYLPQLYIDSAGKLIRDEEIRRLVTGVIQDSLMIAPRLTINPFSGMTASFAVRRYFLGASADAGDVLRAAIPELRNLPDLSDRRIEATAQPTLLDAGLGWRFRMGILELMVEGGWIWAVATDVDVKNVSGEPKRLAENYLHDKILAYGQAPYLSLGLFVVF